MLSCREVTELLSEERDRQLKVSERVQLRLHLAMCQGCSNFKKQLGFLHDACQLFVAEPAAKDRAD